MKSEIVSGFGFSCRQACRSFLLIAWAAGLLWGIWCGFSAGPALVSLMHGLPLVNVTIVGVLAASVLPFLLSAFAVFFSRFWLIPLAFCKAFAFGACAGFLELAFGSAGWLVRLLMLPGMFTAPVLLWYWLRCLEEGPKPIPSLISLGIAGGTAAVHYCILSPFLAMVFLT